MLKHILNNARTGNKLFTVYCLLFTENNAPPMSHINRFMPPPVHFPQRVLNTECQAFFPIVRIGTGHPLIRKGVLPLPLLGPGGGGETNGANVFCFLSPLPLHSLSRHGRVRVLSVIYSQLTLYHRCVLAKSFSGDPKKDDRGPLSIQSSLGETYTRLRERRRGEPILTKGQISGTLYIL
jgi:hypothetical protein